MPLAIRIDEGECSYLPSELALNNTVGPESETMGNKWMMEVKVREAEDMIIKCKYTLISKNSFLLYFNVIYVF